MSNGVTVKLTQVSDSKIIDNLLKAAKDKLYVYVGVQKDTAPRKDDLITNAEVALANEFGTDKIPERSFIRSTIKEKRQKYKDMNIRAAKKILTSNLDQDSLIKLHLATLGQQAENDIKAKITEIRYPELSKKTIEARRSRLLSVTKSKKQKAKIMAASLDKPLIDTAQLRSSIKYLVSKKQKSSI